MTEQDPNQRAPLRAVAPPPVERAPPPVRAGWRSGCLAVGGLLVWGGLLAFDWGRSAHPHSAHLWWSGQVLFLLLVAILVVAIIGTISASR